MAVIKAKPTSPGRRFRTLSSGLDLYKGRSYAPLTQQKSKSGGRNNNGRITTRHIGGGHKHHYRVIDFKRNKDGIPAVVERIEYDPNRSAFIALVLYEDGERKYIIAPKGLKEGSKIVSGADAEISVGNTLELNDIPVGTIVHCVELKPLKGAQLARSAGTSVQHSLKSFGKAGAKRWVGVRPTVRGVAMNPIDHPHGGGEGRTSGGRHPVSPWGTPTKGYRTRSNKRTDSLIIRRRKK